MNDHLAPTSAQYVRLPEATAPLLLVTVDTEEDFDWTAPFSSASVSVASARQLPVAQRIFERYGVTATYAVDYPIADQPSGYGYLRELAQAGACVIGAQLHPWVNPPLEEPISAANSYPGNLPPALERAKLRTLTETIARNLGVRPTVYKAGRYGIGPNTHEILAECGYEIDLSVYARRSFRERAGPDFSDVAPLPYRFGPDGRLLAVPLTCAYTGLLGGLGPALEPALASGPGRALRLPGILARLGLLNRVTLTPEGVRLDEAMALTRRLLRQGTRVFTLAFHSPSLEPGNTPYVRNRADLDRLLAWLEGYFEFFLGEIGGRPATPFALRDLSGIGRTASMDEPGSNVRPFPGTPVARRRQGAGPT